MAKLSVVFFVFCTLLVLQLAASHPDDDSQNKKDKPASSEILGAIPQEGDQPKQSDEDASSKSAEDVIQVAKAKMENAAADFAKKLNF